MDEHGERVVLVVDDGQIVLEARGVHRTAFSSEHSNDVVLQPLKIHRDIVGNSLEGTRPGPVTVAHAVLNGLHH